MKAVLIMILVYCLQCLCDVAEAQENEFLEMDLTELMQVTITSVAKKRENLSDTAAAVYVISQEDIIRSGATTIPDAIRLAPGVQVARISSSKWAVSSRGLNGLFSNSLLVLMDGRTVYSPTFSGTYWDVQNTLMEDIERIEVIRGPGATVWGANAVNGVINIITKNSADTLGGIVTARVGSEEKAHVGTRYGFQLNDEISARLYMSYQDRDSFELYRDGSDAYDSWDNFNSGFRLDSDLPDGTWTVQGDAYVNNEDQLIEAFFTNESPFVSTNIDEVDAKGANILGRYQKDLGTDRLITLQAYYDYADRMESYGDQTHSTIDMDLQYQTYFGKRNELMAGVGYRRIQSDFDSTFMIQLADTERVDQVFSAFIQDAITLIPDKVKLTLGSKIEHNDFSGVEIQPNARILWNISENKVMWGSVSRAVRTPSQIEESGSIISGITAGSDGMAVFNWLRGSEDFDSEEVLTYETGFRFFPNAKLSIDTAFFYNDYEKLNAFALDTTAEVLGDLVWMNGVSGSSYGAELSLKYKPQSWIDLILTYSYIKLEFQADEGIIDMGAAAIDEGSTPKHQISLQGTFDFLQNWQANIWLRYVGELEMSSSLAEELGLVIDDYIECDMNLRWKPREDLEVQLVGQNLFNSSHLEFSQEFFSIPVEVERGVYLKVMYHF